MTHYQTIFDNLDTKSNKILELGIHEGYSLKFWAESFPELDIYGLDNNSLGKCPMFYGNPKIKPYYGNQDDETIINKIFEDAGTFDVVIDDCSHVSNLTIASFNLIKDRLHAGSVYIIEDLGVCERPEFNPENFSVWQFLDSIKEKYKVVKYNDEMVSISGF